MEFTIDFAAVRKITAQEYAQARSEISELGVTEAYQRSRERHDDRLAAAPDASTLACKAGCSWCCHFSVDVRPVEVFAILDFVARHFSAQEQSRVRKEIEANSTLLSKLSDLERVQRNIKCPFLSEGRCTIYAARPQTCRNYHATNAAGCQKSFEEPDNLDIDPDFAPLVYQAGGAHVDAFSKAMGDAGYDIAAYELSTALVAAMTDTESARRRFESKVQASLGLAGMEVPLEFTDLDD
jgi:Fe-S-cluster containining protein